MARSKVPGDGIAKLLREHGLKRYPGAHLKSPWPGHLDLAVKDKTFAYLSVEGEPFSISCKLPQSSAAALILPFTKPTAYGLGKSGWVSASFADGGVPDVEMFKDWIEESYRAQAPKKLVAQLELGGTAPAAAPKKKAPTKTPAKKAPAKKTPAKKTAAKKAPPKRRAR